MTAAEPALPARDPSARLSDALLDPARADRTMLLLLAGYAAVWTLYASISQSSQDIHPDMAELISWSPNLSLGYLKHPPLAAWLVRLWFSVMPLADWSYYLLAMLMPTIALWIVWRLSADYLTLDKRVAGVVLLMFVPFYNFLAVKFNVNTVLLPAWAARRCSSCVPTGPAAFSTARSPVLAPAPACWENTGRCFFSPASSLPP